MVVPSPATSEVLEETPFTICAPRFEQCSSSSISFATVTCLAPVGSDPIFTLDTLLLAPEASGGARDCALLSCMPFRLLDVDCARRSRPEVVNECETQNRIT